MDARGEESLGMAAGLPRAGRSRRTEEAGEGPSERPLKAAFRRSSRGSRQIAGG